MKFPCIFKNKIFNSEVPAVVQWIRNPTAGAQIAEEVRVHPELTWRIKGSSVVAAATQNKFLAQELPYVVSVAIKKKNHKIIPHALQRMAIHLCPSI